MLKIYGSMLCKDCVDCCRDLTNAGIPYEFLDFSQNLGNLKEFLKLRDSLDLFQAAKAAGQIGIPCLVDGQGRVRLQWSDYLDHPDK